MSAGLRYDVVFLGANLSGVVCACLLAQKGKRVMVLDGGEFPRHRPGLPPQAVHPAPWTWSSLTLRPLLREIGFHPLEIQRFEEVNPPLQLVTAAHRLSFYREEARFQRELEREYPGQGQAAMDQWRRCAGEAEPLGQFLKELTGFPPRGWREKLAYRSFVRQRKIGGLLGHKERLGRGDMGQGTYEWERIRLALFTAQADGCLPEKFPAAWLGRSFFLARQSACRLRGDWDELRQIFFKKITLHGGAVLEETRPQQLLVEDGACGGVILARAGAERILARALVLNGNPQALPPLLPGGEDSRMTSFLQPLRPRYRRRGFQWLTYASYLPVGMEGDLLVSFDLQAELCGDNLILVERHPEQPDGGFSNGEKVLLNCCWLAPAEAGEEAEELEKKVRRRLYEVLPFLERGLTWDSRTMELSRERKRSGESPLLEDGIYSLPTSASFETPLHSFAAPLRGLYLTGRSVFPALGRDGEILAARLLAEKLQRDLPQL